MWLSTLSHTSNSVPLRAGICWPLYLRLEGTWPEEEEIHKRSRPGLPGGLSKPLLRGSPSKGPELYGESQGHWESKAEGRKGRNLCQMPLSRDKCDLFGRWGQKRGWGLTLLPTPTQVGTCLRRRPTEGEHCRHMGTRGRDRGCPASG